MLEEVLKIRQLIGNTPQVMLDQGEFGQLHARLEYNNFSGSIKDWAANNILYQAIRDGRINGDTTIVESSSGNFGMSAALHCQRLGLKFIAVVDPQINVTNLKMLQLFAHKVVMVEKPDHTGGYLLTRIETVKEIQRTTPNCFWTNQYENPNNYQGYQGLAHEIKKKFTCLDYLFVSVSSCGTITGLSRYLREQFPELYVIGVDIKGSVIFSDVKRKRSIPGLGAGRRATFLEKDTVDHVMILTQDEIIKGAHKLLRRHSIFGGGSTGACYYAAQRFLGGLKNPNPLAVSLIICPDRGFSYIDTVYNDDWCKKTIQEDARLEAAEAKKLVTKF